MADNGITQYFGDNLAKIIGDKILLVKTDFDAKSYIKNTKKLMVGKSYTERIIMHAEELRKHLPTNYSKAIKILVKILGEENKEQTGMFKHFYWIMPIGKFIELYGLDHFDISIKAIEEVTKRNTGEYAIRPYIRKYPEKTLAVMMAWSKDQNFHLRRLASEGLRPKLPWSPKLDTFIDKPKPVFKLLENLKEDPIKFVQKSVANHLTDYLKVNQEPTIKLLKKWNKSDNKHTMWMVKHATRKFDLDLK